MLLDRVLLGKHVFPVLYHTKEVGPIFEQARETLEEHINKIIYLILFSTMCNGPVIVNACICYGTRSLTSYPVNCPNICIVQSLLTAGTIHITVNTCFQPEAISILCELKYTLNVNTERTWIFFTFDKSK